MSDIKNNSHNQFANDGEPRALDLLLSPTANFEPDDADADDYTEITKVFSDDNEDENFSPARSSTSYLDAASKAAITSYPDSIFARLVEYGLLKKVTDIVLAKVKIPWNLREDATQAVHLKWCLIQAKPQYVRNQLAFFAYLSGQHAALAERRVLGAVCVLPGALFREGKESVFMEAIGAAVNPMDVDEYKDSMELSIDEDDMMRLAKVDENLLTRRLGSLDLNQKQMRIARMVLIERLDASEIAHKLNMRDVYVERLIKQITLKLNDRDAGIITPVEPKKEKKVVIRVPAKKCVERVPDVPKPPLGKTTLLRRRPTARAERAETKVAL